MKFSTSIRYAVQIAILLQAVTWSAILVKHFATEGRIYVDISFKSTAFTLLTISAISFIGLLVMNKYRNREGRGV